MKTRLLLPAFCVVLVPFTAFAGSYERKDYLESYERQYERHTPAPAPAPSSIEPSSGDAQAGSSSYDAYSLYEWKKHKDNSTEATAEPEWVRELKKANEELNKIAKENAEQNLQSTLQDQTDMIEEQQRQLNDMQWDLDRANRKLNNY